MLQSVGAWAAPVMVSVILLAALVRRVPAFSEFTAGAQSGAQSCVGIFPSLIGLITAVAMLRASGLPELLAQAVAPLTARLGLPAELMPLVLLRPVSGSGSIALLRELLQTQGPDGFAGRVAAVMAGATETTFYTLTVYYGAAGVRKTRHTLPAAAAADVTCVLVALLTVRWMFRS